MAKSSELGMQTMDQSLLQHYVAGSITADEALRHADSANDLRLMIKMHDTGGVTEVPSDLTYEGAQAQDKRSG